MEKLKWDYERFKGRFENTENLSFEKDLSWGFQWPQRNYKCSFCKKEFKSAQALGGHMNVHRRDRARMRLSPSSDFPNPNPNPNPSFSSSSSSATRFLAYNLKCGSSVAATSSSPAPATDQEGDAGKNLKKGVLFRVDDVEGFARRNDDPRIWKAKEFVTVDLNSSLVQHAKEDLDLELRLGYSN